MTSKFSKELFSAIAYRLRALLSVLDRSFEDCMAYGAMNALSVIGSQEDISAKDASGKAISKSSTNFKYSLTNDRFPSGLGLAMFLANSEKGLSYPSGGLTGMRKALIHSIHSNGGHVLSNILVQGITFDNNSDKVRASGVQTVIDGRSLGESLSVLIL